MNLYLRQTDPPAQKQKGRTEDGKATCTEGQGPIERHRKGGKHEEGSSRRRGGWGLETDAFNQGCSAGRETGQGSGEPDRKPVVRRERRKAEGHIKSPLRL